MNIFKRIWNFYRTAPLGETIATLGAVGFASGMYYFFNVIDNTDFDNLAMISKLTTLLAPATPLYFGIGGCAMAELQFNLKHRLEKAIEEHGFDERQIKPLMNEWCDRQVALVVAEEYGQQAVFEQMYKEMKTEVSYPDLRNF